MKNAPHTAGAVRGVSSLFAVVSDFWEVFGFVPRFPGPPRLTGGYNVQTGVEKFENRVN